MQENRKVFGLSAERGRWIFLALGFMIYLINGSIYSWSIFRKPLEQLFSVGATESGLPYMVYLGFSAVTMVIAGRWLATYGPRVVIILGATILGAGWILSSFAPSMIFMVLSFGIIAGGGSGILYGGPIAVSTRWFPDKKGLAVGLVLVGIGSSPVIMAPLTQMFVDRYGPLQTFGMLGALFLALMVIFAIPLRFPPLDWKPRRCLVPETRCVAVAEIDTSKMIKTSTFYLLWSCYLIGSLSGLMAIGISSPVGQELIRIDPQTSAMTVSIFAVFNGIGRPLFGWLSDRITARYAALVSFIIIFGASIGMANAGEGRVLLYVLSFSGFWLALGGWLTMAPTYTATFFGTQNHSKNYGVLFTAYGLGAIVGTLFSGTIRDIFGSYIYTFYPLAALACFGMILAVILTKPLKTPRYDGAFT